MQSNNDVNYSYEQEPNKPYAAAKKVYKPYFYDDSDIYANINLDPAIIRQLKITSETELTQEITPEGILLKYFRGGV